MERFKINFWDKEENHQQENSNNNPFLNNKYSSINFNKTSMTSNPHRQPNFKTARKTFAKKIRQEQIEDIKKKLRKAWQANCLSTINGFQGRQLMKIVEQHQQNTLTKFTLQSNTKHKKGNMDEETFQTRMRQSTQMIQNFNEKKDFFYNFQIWSQMASKMQRSIKTPQNEKEIDKQELQKDLQAMVIILSKQYLMQDIKWIQQKVVNYSHLQLIASWVDEIFSKFYLIKQENEEIQALFDILVTLLILFELKIENIEKKYSGDVKGEVIALSQYRQKMWANKTLLEKILSNDEEYFWKWNIMQYSGVIEIKIYSFFTIVEIMQKKICEFHHLEQKIILFGHMNFLIQLLQLLKTLYFSIFDQIKRQQTIRSQQSFNYKNQFQIYHKLVAKQCSSIIKNLVQELQQCQLLMSNKRQAIYQIHQIVNEVIIIMDKLQTTYLDLGIVVSKRSKGEKMIREDYDEQPNVYQAWRKLLHENKKYTSNLQIWKFYQQNHFIANFLYQKLHEMQKLSQQFTYNSNQNHSHLMDQRKEHISNKLSIMTKLIKLTQISLIKKKQILDNYSMDNIILVIETLKIRNVLEVMILKHVQAYDEHYIFGYGDELNSLSQIDEYLRNVEYGGDKQTKYCLVVLNYFSNLFIEQFRMFEIFSNFNDKIVLNIESVSFQHAQKIKELKAMVIYQIQLLTKILDQYWYDDQNSFLKYSSFLSYTLIDEENSTLFKNILNMYNSITGVSKKKQNQIRQELMKYAQNLIYFLLPLNNHFDDIKIMSNDVDEGQRQKEVERFYDIVKRYSIFIQQQDQKKQKENVKKIFQLNSIVRQIDDFIDLMALFLDSYNFQINFSAINMLKMLMYYAKNEDQFNFFKNRIQSNGNQLKLKIEQLINKSDHSKLCQNGQEFLDIFEKGFQGENERRMEEGYGEEIEI